MYLTEIALIEKTEKNVDLPAFCLETEGTSRSKVLFTLYFFLCSFLFQVKVFEFTANPPIQDAIMDSSDPSSSNFNSLEILLFFFISFGLFAFG